jgi:hypothetical protein
VLAMLTVLPIGVTSLELSVHCTAPLFTALRRFQHLSELHLTGAGGDGQWQWQGWGRHAAIVLPRLRRLRLDFSGAHHDFDTRVVWSSSYCQRLPSGMHAMLAPACHLISLGLVVESSNDVVAACKALPALQKLR